MEEHKMTTRDRFSFTKLAITVAILTLLAGAASVGAAEPEWQVKVGGVWVQPALSYSMVNSEGLSFSADSDDAIGLSVALEHRFSQRLGLELGALQASPDVILRVEAPGGETAEASDGLAYTPITLGLNLYLTPGRPVEVYLTPVLAYVMYGDLTFSAGDSIASIKVDNQWTWGLNLGANVRLGDGPWRFSGAVSYVRTALPATDLESGGTENIDFNPFAVTLGFGYRF
jgi:outer membrane protein W